MEREHLPIFLMNKGNELMTNEASEQRECVNGCYSKMNGVVSDKDDGCVLTICFN